MQVKLLNKGNTGEAVLIGTLDSVSSPQAEKVLTDIAERFDTLVLNLQDLEYTSSAGLRVIKGLQIKMNKKGGSLILKHTRPMVMEVFDMTGFSRFLKFED